MNLNGTYDGWSRTFSGPDVTWAGANPFSTGFCFGFDDGTVAFTDENGVRDVLREKYSESGEPINGLASDGATCFAVSTRSDVTFVMKNADGGSTASIFPSGSHGIAVTHSGYYVSPLGINGLLVMKPSPEEIKQPMRIAEGPKDRLYFLRALPLHDERGKEALVFATRRDGVGYTAFAGNESVRNVHTITSLGLDIIDVCEIRPGTLATAAISIDGILMLFSDVLNSLHPITIKLGGIEGTVYRLLSSRGHLFVLTSKAMYAWLGLIDGLLDGNPIEENSVPVIMPMEAVDATLVRDTVLLVVMAVNEVRRIDIRTIEKLSSTRTDSFVRTTLTPTWLEKDISQSLLSAIVG